MPFVNRGEAGEIEAAGALKPGHHGPPLSHAPTREPSAVVTPCVMA